jgi:hypothetical protein
MIHFIDSLLSSFTAQLVPMKGARIDNFLTGVHFLAGGRGGLGDIFYIVKDVETGG